jgi:hypothetical protein
MASYVPSAGFGDDGKELASSTPKGKGKGAKKEKKEKDKNAPKGSPAATAAHYHLQATHMHSFLMNMDCRFQVCCCSTVPITLIPDPSTSVHTGASSSYIIFSTKIRQTIKDEHPDMANKDIIRETGVRWKALSAEEKIPYEEMATADKERWDTKKLGA